MLNNTKSKRKGNNFELKISKELSNWMFDNPTILSRHQTSGAIKTAWVGDIVPQKQLPVEWDDFFPLYIECKSGYKEKLPTFFNFEIINKWLKKCLLDITDEQNIIFLICQFTNMRNILLFTNRLLYYNWILCLNIENVIFYMYNYKNIISQPFNNIINL